MFRDVLSLTMLVFGKCPSLHFTLSNPTRSARTNKPEVPPPLHVTHSALSVSAGECKEMRPHRVPGGQVRPKARKGFRPRWSREAQR